MELGVFARIVTVRVVTLELPGDREHKEDLAIWWARISEQLWFASWATRAFDAAPGTAADVRLAGKYSGAGRARACGVALSRRDELMAFRIGRRKFAAGWGGVADRRERLEGLRTCGSGFSRGEEEIRD